MSGHNKWSKIKHKKASTDAKKSKVFSKYARLIATESKKAGGDVTSPGLATAIARAQAENMPKDNIERAVAKGTEKDAASLDEITYEFYGPGGSAFIVEALTDNTNRTTPEIKHLLSKRGFELAQPGAAAWVFTKAEGVWTPNTTIPVSPEDFETCEILMEELSEHEDVQDVYTNAQQ